MKKFWGHPWVVALCNVALVLLLYSLMRVVCYVVNDDLFSDVGVRHLFEILGGGVRFDLTAVLYLSSLYIILSILPLPMRVRNHATWQRFLVWLFWIPNLLGILVNTIDIVYLRFSDRRTTCTFWTEFQHETNLWRILCEGVLDYWYVSLIGLAIMASLIVFTRRYSLVSRNSRVFYYVHETLLFAVTIYFCVIGIRGGFGRYTRPITISNALQYTDVPREAALVLNTPFSLMKSIGSTRYEEPAYFPEEELERHMTPIHQPKVQRDNVQGTKENVVVLILESFGTEYIGFYNRDIEGYKGYTPFLDSLLEQSVTFEHSYASGRKSIDAMPSVLSSIPMLIEPYIVTPYSTNSVSSIAECLERKGYTTAFFHGAPNGSMGFQAYARAAGLDAYYGKKEFDETNEDNDAFDGTWAVWDEPFLQFYAQTMNTMQEPFMTAVFTASSHHPFRIPTQYKDVFPKGAKPIHQTIGYADHALRRFFETARQQAWYEHTLFVLTADHTNEATLPQYKNARGLFRVPVAFYHPRWTQAERRDEVVSQTDIMPSVLAYVGFDEPFFAFGEDALTQSKQHPYAICYEEPYFQLFTDSLMIQFDGERITNGVSDSAALDYLKAYIQQYTGRMIRDQLTTQ